METQANYKLVGLFVVITALALIASLFWLANAGGNRNAQYYTVYFKQHGLSGLQKDSYVTMKGITIGSVTDYHISPTNIEEVKVTLQLDDGIPIKTTTSAIITRNLLTGIAAVELTGGGQNDPDLVGTPEGEVYPVVKEGLSQLDQITDSIPGLLEKVSGLANRIEAFTSEENVKSWNTTLKNLEALSSWLANSQTQVESVLKQVEIVSKNVATVSKDLSTFAKSTQSSITKVSNEASSTFKQIGGTFEELQVQTRAVSNSLTNASQVFTQEVSTVGQSVSEAADSFSKTIEGFEDPRTLITGPRQKALGPGESLAQ